MKLQSCAGAQDMHERTSSTRRCTNACHRQEALSFGHHEPKEMEQTRKLSCLSSILRLYTFFIQSMHFFSLLLVGFWASFVPASNEVSALAVRSDRYWDLEADKNLVAGCTSEESRSVCCKQCYHQPGACTDLFLGSAAATTKEV